jgi:hypothetical protein
MRDAGAVKPSILHPASHSFFSDCRFSNVAGRGGLLRRGNIVAAETLTRRNMA